MNLQEIVDINLLQKVQDTFAEATGLAAITVDFRGNPITRYSNFSPFCNLLRKDPRFVDTCFKCDAYGGLEAARRETSYIYRCHAGLVDFAVPIIVKGQMLGSMLVGQVKMHESGSNKLDSILKESSDWKDNNEMVKAYAEIPVFPYEKIQAAAEMMFHVINNMFENDIMKYVQEELRMKDQQLIDQMKVQAELEKALSLKQIKALQILVNPHFLFNSMNTLSCLAILEKADKTQDVIFVLTEIMKYILTHYDDDVTLKEEILHVEKYIKLQKLRLEDRLHVFIDIPEEIQSIKIPPLILQSIVDNGIIHGIEPKDEKGIITINGYMLDDDCMIEVSDNGVGMSEEKIASILDETMSLQDEDYKKGMGLRHFNTILESHYGEAYKLAITQNSEGGTTVKMRIPIN